MFVHVNTGAKNKWLFINFYSTYENFMYEMAIEERIVTFVQQ